MIYLSVDFDYWNDYCASLKTFKSIVKNIVDRNLPVDFVETHEGLVKFVNTSRCSTLFNIDYHSDITDSVYNLFDIVPGDKDEGIWVNMINPDLRDNFLWIYPNQKCYNHEGRCDAEKNPFTARKQDQVSGWKSVRRRLAIMPTKTEWDSIARVGFSLSPDWTEKHVYVQQRDILLDAGLLSEDTSNEFDEAMEIYL